VLPSGEWLCFACQLTTFYSPLIPLKRRFLCRLGLSVGFLYRLGLGLAVVISVSFSVLGLSLGAGLILDFVSVRDGLIIERLIIEFQSVRDGLIIALTLTPEKNRSRKIKTSPHTVP